MEMTGCNSARPFSQRQSEIVRLIASGHTNKELAGIIGIGEGTVHTHLARLFRRFGVCSRAALVAVWLLEAKYVEPFKAIDIEHSAANGDRLGEDRNSVTTGI